MKRIVLCADGTWNEPEQVDQQTGKRKPSNVMKLARAVKPTAGDGIEQVVYYHEGLGTGGPLDKFTGGAFGDGMEANILSLYRFLVYNYAPGDQLYFFGFSRGAFTVRSLAGLMAKIGLVNKGDDFYAPELYKVYEKQAKEGSDEWTLAHHHIESIRPCPTIDFIGVWDTVGALGAPGALGQLFNRHKYDYHDVGLNPAITRAFQALAIDERRKPFAPSLWSRPAGWTGDLEQRWFAGVHTNVGGGCNPDGLANIALQWMVGKAQAAKLDLDASYLAHYTPHADSVMKDSFSAMYQLMGAYVRPICRSRLEDGEVVDASVYQRIGLTASQLQGVLYTPANVPKRWLVSS